MTQKQEVLKQLKEFGYVSRNRALQNYISRLSAIILDLKKEGLKLEGEHRKTQYGQDYVYLIKTPQKPISSPTRQATKQDQLFKVRIYN